MKNQNETSAEDIATVPNKVGTFKRKLLRLAEVNLDDTDDVAPVTKHELHDILSNLDVDEQSLVLSVVNDCCENNFEIFDDLVSFLATCDDDAFTEISDVILNLLGELETFYDTYDEPDVPNDAVSEDSEDTVDEKLINIAHTRDLRRQRAKSLWKRNAVLRARFRKTAQGKREKKAAKLYLKRYRKANKTRLKRYAQEYAKDLAKKAKK